MRGEARKRELILHAALTLNSSRSLSEGSGKGWRDQSKEPPQYGPRRYALQTPISRLGTAPASKSSSHRQSTSATQQGQSYASDIIGKSREGVVEFFIHVNFTCS